MTMIMPIIRAGKEIGKADIRTAVENAVNDFDGIVGVVSIESDKSGSYCAIYTTKGDDTVGTIVKLRCEECDKDEPAAAVVIFGSGQNVVCRNGHAHEVTEEFWNDWGYSIR